MKACFRLILFLTALLVPISLKAQQPAPPIDPNPLARPEPLTSIASSEPEKLLSAIRGKIVSAGFNVSSINTAAGILEAKKPDKPGSKDEDRIVIWLQRNLREPLKYLEVYFLYGRYEDIWTASGEGVYRVAVKNDFEENRVGSLKQAILSLSDSQ